MKKNSVLRQIYIDQEQSKIEKSEEISKTDGNNLFLLKWILIGALINGIILAPFVVLYIRQQNNVTTESVTIISTTVTTTALSLRWISTGTIIAGTGSSGVNANELNYPYGLALDSSNSLYIVDRQNNRVQKYLARASSGSTVAGQASGIGGSSSSQLDQPGYLIVDSNNNVYVTDSLNHRIQLWYNGASSGLTVAGNGVRGTALNQLDTPRGITRDPNSGTLYISDHYNHRIMCYTSGATSGTVAAGGNGCGSSLTQLCQPVGIQFDSSSNSLFIVNFGAHTIVRWVLGTSSGTLIAGVYGSQGSTSTRLNAPAGLTVDSSGNVYVADVNNHRIILFMTGQTNGTIIAGTSGISGSSLSLLSSPFWVSLDNQLNLYVSDRDNQRIIKFLRY